MKHFYFSSMLLLIVVTSIAPMPGAAQCTVTIPAVGTNYSQTNVINTNNVTIPYYATGYTWICAGDTVYDHYGQGGDWNTVGIFFLEKDAAFIYDGGGAGYSIWAKAGAYYYSNNPNNSVHADSMAHITPGVAPGCCGGVYVTCPVVFDYSLITPGTGCATAAAKPVAAFTASQTTVCAGDTVTFTDQSTGLPTSRQWTFTGGSPATSATKSQQVVFNTTGSHDVKLVVTNSGGTDSLTKSGYITVNPLPVAGTISGTNTICAGDTVQLSVTGGSGILNWYAGPSALSLVPAPADTSTTVIVSGITSATYFQVSDSNSCGIVRSGIYTVSVNPLPVPHDTTYIPKICSGDTTQICSARFASYLWNTGDTTQCTTVSSAGGYWVTVTDANHCSAVSGHQQLTVFAVPSVSIIHLGDTLSSFGAVSYQWLKDNAPLTNDTSSIYVATGPGSYSVQVTDSNGCTATSQPVVISGLENLAKENVTIYPNPSTGNWLLAISNELIGSTMEMFDEQGRLVFHSKLSTPNSTLQPEVPGGVYYLRISNGDLIVLRKLVKL